MTSLALTAPTAGLHTAWLDARDDWGPGVHEDGYGIRPSARRRGLATWALGRILDEAHSTGLHRVLIICEADDVPSMKTIERHGGVLEGIRHSETVRSGATGWTSRTA
jgi:RimJ/RimL family protein N-acetyltransferase